MTSKKQLLKKDILFPELSYSIIGCAFDVFNEIGFGHHEKFYQRVMQEAFSLNNINFKQQVRYDLTFKDKIIGRNYFDFLVDDKIIVELKKDKRFSKQNIDQVYQYLRISNLQLAILINFSKTGVIFKRILNLNEPKQNQ